MAIEKQVIHIPFTEGIDSEKHKYAVPPPGLSEAVNLVADNDGSFSQRPGISSIGSSCIAVKGVHDYLLRARAAYDSYGLYAELSSYVNRNGVTWGATSTTSISDEFLCSSISYSEVAGVGKYIDYDEYADLGCYIYYDGLTIVERSSNNVLLTYKMPFEAAKLAVVGTSLHVFTVNSGTMLVYRFDLTNLSSAPTAQTVSTDVYNFDQTTFDVTSLGGNTYAVYKSESSTGYYTSRISESLAVITTNLRTTIQEVACIGCCIDSGRLLVALNIGVGTSFDVYAHSYDVSDMSVHRLKLIDTEIGFGGRVTAVDGYICYERRLQFTPTSLPAIGYYQVKTIAYDVGTGTTGIVSLIDNATISSKPVKDLYGSLYAVLTFLSQDQAAMYCALTSLIRRAAVATFNNGTAFTETNTPTGHDSRPNFLPRLVLRTDGDNAETPLADNIVIPTAFVYDILDIRTDFVAKASLLTVSLGSNTSLRSSVLTNEDTLLIPSASGLFEYSQGAIRRVGFRTYPTVVSIGAFTGAGGFNDAGTYRYRLYFESRGVSGEVDRSTFGASAEVVVATGEDVHIIVPNLNFPSFGVYGGVEISVYRSEDGGANYYRIPELTKQISASSGAYVEIIDTGYSTNGGEPDVVFNSGALDNAPTGLFEHIAYGRNRLFYTVGTDRVYCTKYKQEGEAFAFNETLYIDIPSIGGRITNLVVGEDYIWVFKEEAIYYITGNGPDNNGVGEFGQPNMISETIGADRYSVARLPDRVIFRSKKGWFAIDRGLGLTYIGSAVNKYDSRRIVGLTDLDSKKRIHVLLDDDASEVNLLVYDYGLDIWTEWSVPVDGVTTSITSYEDTLAYSCLDSTYQSVSSWTDDGSHVPTRLTTGWISMNGLMGYAKCYEYGILGEYETDSVIEVRATYDGNESFGQVDHYKKALLNSVDGYLPGDAIAVRNKLTQQKCRQLKLQIVNDGTYVNPNLAPDLDSVSSGVTLAGFTLSGQLVGATLVTPEGSQPGYHNNTQVTAVGGTDIGMGTEGYIELSVKGKGTVWVDIDNVNGTIHSNLPYLTASGYNKVEFDVADYTKLKIWVNNPGNDRVDFYFTSGATYFEVFGLKVNNGDKVNRNVPDPGAISVAGGRYKLNGISLELGLKNGIYKGRMK